MKRYETRVARAFRGVEGTADSHDDAIPPEAAALVEMSLSDAQLSTFWARILDNIDAARRMAALFVSTQNVHDVVHSAAVSFVQDAQRSKKAEPFPASEDRFRRKFLKMVRNRAIDCVRGKRPACPIHSHWGIDPEPDVAGRNVADRELDTVFARNDQGKYDAPAPTVPRARNDLDGLHYILRSHMDDLSQAEREIIEQAYFQEQPRDEIAARRGISLNTYDNQRKAACRKLRDSMMAVVDFCYDIDLPDWYDRIAELNERHEARQRRRASGKKEKRSTSGGDHSNFQGDQSTPRGKAA